MIKPKCENPSPGEESKHRIIFRVLLEVEIRHLTLLNRSTYRTIGRRASQFPITKDQDTVSTSTKPPKKPGLKRHPLLRIKLNLYWQKKSFSEHGAFLMHSFTENILILHEFICKFTNLIDSIC